MSRRRLNFAIPAVCFLSAIVVWSTYNPVQLPLLGDNAHQFFISERAASGVPPHLSQLSAKHSLTFLLTGLAISIGRGLTIDDIWSARVLSLLIFAGSVWLTGIITFDLAKNRFAAMLAALSLVAFSGYVYQVAQCCRPKVFLVFFMLLAIYAAIRRQPFWLGVWAGLSFLCWQPALIMLGGAILVGLFQVERWNWLKSTCSGALIVVVGYEAYFWWHGVLAEQLRQSYYFPANFMPGEFNGWVALIEVIYYWARGFFMHPAPVFLLVGELSFGVIIWRSGFHFSKLCRDRPGWVYLFVCLNAALIFSIYEHQGYTDLFLLIPFLAILTGYGATMLWRADRFRTLARSLVVISVICLVMSILSGPYLMGTNPGSPFARARYTLQDQRNLAEQVKQLHMEKGDMYVIGCAHLLAFNRMDNWSMNNAFFRGVREYLLSTATGGPEVPWEPKPLPPVILTCRYDLPPELQSVLDRKYYESTFAAFQQQNISIWFRRQ